MKYIEWILYKWIHYDVHNLEESIFKDVISPPFELEIQLEDQRAQKIQDTTKNKQTNKQNKVVLAQVKKNWPREQNRV